MPGFHKVDNRKFLVPVSEQRISRIVPLVLNAESKQTGLLRLSALLVFAAVQIVCLACRHESSCQHCLTRIYCDVHKIFEALIYMPEWRLVYGKPRDQGTGCTQYRAGGQPPEHNRLPNEEGRATLILGVTNPAYLPMSLQVLSALHG